LLSLGVALKNIATTASKPKGDSTWIPDQPTATDITIRNPFPPSST
jgi:hypothetical protein